MNQLKPCPFCGSADLEIIDLTGEEDFAVSCNKCNANGGVYGGSDSTSPEDATEFWNNRPFPDERVKEAVEVLTRVAFEAKNSFKKGKKAHYLEDENGEAMFVISSDALDDVRKALAALQDMNEKETL